MKQYIVPGLFLAGTILFAVLYVVGPSNNGGKGIASSETSQGAIRYNRVQNLKNQANIRQDLKRQQAILNRRMNKPGLDPDRHKKSGFHTTDLNKDLGPAAEDLDSGGSVGALTLDQKMDEFLAKREVFEEIENAKRQEYVDTFVREARQMGFDVKVDDNFDIVSVNKISSPNQ